MTGHGGGGVQCGKVEHVSILAYLGQKELWDKKGFSALLVTLLMEKRQQCLLCGSVQVTASGEPIAIFGDILIDGHPSIHVKKWAGTSNPLLFSIMVVLL